MTSPNVPEPELYVCVRQDAGKLAGAVTLHGLLRETKQEAYQIWLANLPRYLGPQVGLKHLPA